MAVLPLRMIGDPVLRTPAREVGVVDDSVRRLIEDMLTTMDAVGGIGLAAPQVGVGLRIFTYDVAGSRGAVVDPTVETSGSPEFTPHDSAAGPATGTNLVREGCLSIADVHGPVGRPQRARLTGLAPDGGRVDVEASGLLAVCFQHEADHLDGRLFVDRLVGEEKRAALRTLRQTPQDADSSPAARRAPSAGGSFFAAGR
ncbi:peptide deformylase [Nesterenkonia sp. F]|uniref:peptide deformylase n=1 Tax=Nesterenkonia sp. F TaxID=795955 RepID=UPI000255CEAF|nr:peptide deformylase [Nesterenkonia sp. F]